MISYFLASYRLKTSCPTFVSSFLQFVALQNPEINLHLQLINAANLNLFQILKHEF